MTLFKVLDFKRIFNLLFFSSLAFLILIFLIRFFSIYYDLNLDKFIFIYDRKEFYELILLKIYGISFILLFSMLLFIERNQFKGFLIQNKILLLFIFSFTIYYFLMGSRIRGMFIFSIICTFFVYGLIPFLSISKIVYSNDFINQKKICLYILSIYLLLPLFIFLLHYLITSDKYFQFEYFPQLYTVDSFRGFALDRVQYGFISGITILMIFLERENIRCSSLLVFLLSIGIYLAMSRASILALIFSILFYIFIKKINIIKYVIYSIFVIIAFLLFAYIFSDRMDLFSDGGNRIHILLGSINKIFENGFVSFLFGSGEFYTTFNEGLYPHNMILQSIMNFGVVISAFWLVILFIFFKSINNEAKSIFIYVCIFAQFQPGFSAFIFMPMTLFAYICILLFNFKTRIENDNIIA